MDRITWQKTFGVHDVDMEFIDAALKSGCVVAEVENPPLDYADVKITIDKK